MKDRFDNIVMRKLAVPVRRGERYAVIYVFFHHCIPCGYLLACFLLPSRAELQTRSSSLVSCRVLQAEKERANPSQQVVEPVVVFLLDFLLVFIHLRL